MIFPWADLNLHQYWTQTTDGPGDPNPSQLWVSKQIVGLASAIDYMHTSGVTHGDIKPDNILGFEKSKDQEGHLVLGDFGLSRLNPDDATGGTPKVLGFTASYRPPVLDMRGTRINRAQDIWSFGCVLLEMKCWLLGGMSLVEDFEHARGDQDGKHFGHGLQEFFSRGRSTGRLLFRFEVKAEVREVGNPSHADL
jgi:serine/threonine protein kinase